MLVTSKYYPEIILNHKGNSYIFHNGVCEMPDDVAKEVVAINNNYEIGGKKKEEIKPAKKKSRKIVR